MPTITDPDSLAQTTDVVFDTTAKTIELLSTGAISVNDGAGDVGGVTGQCVYSFCVEEWIGDTALNKQPFPFASPSNGEQLILINGWNWKDDASRALLRSVGWRVEATEGANPSEIWAGIVTLSGPGAADQVYYDISSTQDTPTDFAFAGPINAPLQVYRDDQPDGDTADASEFDYRSFLTLYARPAGKTYASSSLADIGVSELAGQVYAFALPVLTDTAASDTSPSGAPYSGMSITYHATPQSLAVGASSYNFGVTIEANGGTTQQIYDFIQNELRKASDIDASGSTVIGSTAAALLTFDGTTLTSISTTNPNGGGTGVYIANFAGSAQNNIRLTDNTGTVRTFPSTVTIQMGFDTDLVGSTAANYALFESAAFGTASAVIVQDSSSVDISGAITGATISKAYTYSGDLAVTLAAMGDDGAQYVTATGTITSTGLTISVDAATELGYAA